MKAFEAKKMTEKAKAIATMPGIYKKIEAVAQAGNSEVYLKKKDINYLQVEQLKEDGFTVEVDKECNGYDTSYTKGYFVRW